MTTVETPGNRAAEKQSLNPSPTAPEKVIEVIYDGECPVCSYLFERNLRLRADGWDLVLTDARDHPEVARMLMDRYSIDINREFGARIDGEWHFGSGALFALYFADHVKRVWARKILLKILGVLYPMLRMGRSVLLTILRRRKITY